MSPSPMSIRGCTTGGTASRRWIVAALAVALVGFAGSVFADAGSGQGKKLAPVATAKSNTTAVIVVSEDANGNATPTNTEGTGRAPASPLAPSNDDCAGAIAIPAGPFPLNTAPVDAIDATPQGTDEGIFTCAATDYTVWYSFTPAETALYTFTTCAALGAVGQTAIDTVIGIYDSTAGACPQGASLVCNDSSACGDAGTDRSIASSVLVAGETYFIVVGNWQPGGPLGGANSTYVLNVAKSNPPANDTCSAPTALQLNRVTNGTTAGAQNDYFVTSAACYTGVGHTPVSAQGRDVVFSFTAPADGSYSFRYVQDDSGASLRGQNPVLYTSASCPAPGAVTCTQAANRMLPATGQNRSEEIRCQALTTGQTVYVFFDDAAAGNNGGPLGVEVVACNPDVEPNDDPASANANACYRNGTTSPVGDVDFFDLGTPAAGSKVFAAIDGVASNDADWELRVTTSTDTLQYDDNDGTSQIGSNSPAIGGTPTTGAQTFVRVNRKAAGVAAEPYHLYAVVQTGSPEIEIETPIPGFPPSNASYYYGDILTGGGYVRGIHTTATDQDCYKFVANVGDEIAMFSDNNPDRVAGGVVNTWPILRDLVGGPPMATRFTGQVTRNNITPSPGTLTGTTPNIVSEFWNYRARYTGLYMVCYYPDAASGAYPLPYIGSISLNCGPIPAPASRVTDVSITKTGPAGPINTSDVIEYTITVTNNGTDIAQEVRIVDSLPAELGFLGLLVDDGFGGNNVGCVTLPSDLTNDAPIDCTNFSMAPGSTTTYTLFAQVQNCIGAGLTIANTATITSTASTDPDPSNNSSTWNFDTVQDGNCTDFNACTEGDRCEGTTCVATPVNCDDGSVCTDDSCDVNTGCINDSTPGDQCDDGNPCTGDACDPIDGCVFPPKDAGFVCNDFFNCTLNDACDGIGNCAGVSVCNDGNPCTDDYADEFDNCACAYGPTYEGAPCSDGNACTDGELCDGANSCVGGGPTNCDDSNACTSDSCDPASGCLNTAIVCDDGNACTIDSCDPATGCTVTPVVCDDGNACTADACDPASGCYATPISCDDNNACTTDSCDPASGCAYDVVNCDDGDCCTIDSCDPAVGCTYAPNKAAPVFVDQPSLGTCAMLWPPNHGYADFGVNDTGASAQSACGIASIQFASCSSSQPENAVGTGDGNSLRDCVYEPGAAHLRAERDGGCSPVGRSYSMTLVAVDVCGNATVSDAFGVGVWHDRGHAPANGGPVYAANGNKNETRSGANGTYGPGCGAGNPACGEAGQTPDTSDADPEMEIEQDAAISVGDLKLQKAAGNNLQLTWTTPTHVAGINVTRFHVYRLDPVTLFWTQIATVPKQDNSFLVPGLSDGVDFQYKVSAVIK